MIRRFLMPFAWMLAFGASAALAAEDEDEEAAGERFRVDGDRLIYNTEALVDGKELSIRFDDIAVLRRLLRENGELRVLELESTGGSVFSARRIADLVIDFGLDTHVRNACESSCVTILLGGVNRTMARGARIGFHQPTWSVRSITEYYEDYREEEAWETPFDFASWVYNDTQTETYNRLTYMLSRGVDPTFAIQTLRRPDASMWRPYRAVLLAAGVLTE